VKATISFNLPEDREDFDFALNGVKYYCAITEIDNWLRGLAKYGNIKMVSIEDVREKIRKELDWK
jgi:hypothetical protein